MQRARPEQLRSALIVVDELVKSGILFVPMPVVTPDDLPKLRAELEARLDQIEAMIDNE